MKVTVTVNLYEIMEDIYTNIVFACVSVSLFRRELAFNNNYNKLLALAPCMSTISCKKSPNRVPGFQDSCLQEAQANRKLYIIKRLKILLS